MSLLKNIKGVIAILTVSISLISPTVASEFSDSKLTLMCDFFSENKEQCYDEVTFLKSKDTKNSIIGQCFSKYSSVKKFNSCLKYEYNPLIFLKHQKNRAVSTRKIFDMKDQIVNVCGDIKDSSVRFNCVRESYLLLEKGKIPTNWLENSCLYTNKKLSKFVNCVNVIKNEALSDNNLIISIPTLISALDTWDKKINNRVSLYFNQVYKECESKYSKINAFECMDGKMNRNISTIISFDFSNSACFKYGEYEKFDKCLNKNMK